MITTVSRAALLACAVAASVSAQTPARDAAASLRLRYASFDPTLSTPDVPAGLRSDAAQRLLAGRLREVARFPDGRGITVIALE